MKSPMDDSEFAELLESYTFGDIAPTDQQRLTRAVLDSPERAGDFAKAHEIREQFADGRFRREALDILEEGTVVSDIGYSARGIIYAPMPPKAVSLDRRSRIGRYRWYAAGAAAAAAVLIAAYVAFRLDPPVDVASSQTAAAPPTVAVTPTVPPLVSMSPADTPALAAGLALGFVAFERPAREAHGVRLDLPGGRSYASNVQVTVRVTLDVAARVYAIVRGPTGLIRQVYPVPTEEPRVLEPGPRTFAFAASEPFDPPSGGTFILRVFKVADLSRAAETDWRWMAGNAEFAERTYTVPPR